MKGSAFRSEPRLRRGDQSARSRRCLPAVLEDERPGQAVDSYYLAGRRDCSMFDQWRLLTEQFNAARESSFSSRRTGSARSGRSSPALSVASVGGRHRTRSQMTYRQEHGRRESRTSDRNSQRSSRSNYAHFHRGDKDPESSSESESSGRSSGEESEEEMDERVPVRTQKRKHRTAPAPVYYPQPIVYQLPFYPPMPYYFPPSLPMTPPVMPLHQTPFVAAPPKRPQKREISTQCRPQSAPSFPKPIVSCKLQVPRADSPEDPPPAVQLTHPPIALEIGLSETKSLAEIFREKRRDFEQKADERKVAKATHTEKTQEELRKLRKDMLKGASSVAKDSELTVPLREEQTEGEPKKREPNPALLERLAAGRKAKISKKEMLELTRKNYEALPEVVRKKEEEQKRADILQRISQKKEYERRLQEHQRKGKEPTSPSSISS